MITSTSINVKWEIVPNGNNITHYILCFEPAPISPEKICSDTETVVGAKEKNILLLDLSPFTTYEIVIKAATLTETGHYAGITVITLEGGRYISNIHTYQRVVAIYFGLYPDKKR